MPDVNVSDIEEKFQLLLKRLRLLHNEKQKLEHKVIELESEIGSQKALLEGMEEKMDVLRMTSSPGDNEGNEHEFRKEIRTTINSYIQEIDNCIALLNE